MVDKGPILILSDTGLPELEACFSRSGLGFEAHPLAWADSEAGNDFSAVVLDPDPQDEVLPLIQTCKSNWPETPLIFLDDSPDATQEFGEAACLDRASTPQEIVGVLGQMAGISLEPPRPGKTYPFGTIVGQSANIIKVFSLISRVARTDSTVLITGESGTGKELIAQAIHHESARRARPLVPVNCGAIPEELLESELFGHEKGAFTSAIRTRIGRFELAEGGTVFLDEIGEMSPQLQVKLLRVLQEHQFERVGGTRTIRADIRVVAATNQNLKEAVKEGRFREDLYYRLDVIPIQAPPLRDRAEDIHLLVDYFLEKFNASMEERLEGLDEEALTALLNYDWPGNVRELENLIERMTILCDGPTISLDDLPERFGGAVAAPARGIATLPDQGFSLNKYLAGVEKELILQALEKAGGVKKKAADLLGINRTTLVEKMKKKGMM